MIWNPATFGLEVPEDVAPIAAQDRQRYYGVGIKGLLDVGLLRSGQQLIAERNGMQYGAKVTPDGEIELDNGHREGSPSMAGAAALGSPSCNGWTFWQTDTARGLDRLARLRDDYLERQRR